MDLTSFNTWFKDLAQERWRQEQAAKVRAKAELRLFVLFCYWREFEQCLHAAALA